MPRGGNIGSTRVPTGVIPGATRSWAELLEEYPELENAIKSALPATRDSFRPDRRDKGFEKKFPGYRDVGNL